MPKGSVREQRRQARIARQRRQRTILTAAGVVAVILVAVIIYFAITNQQQVAAVASQTSTAATALASQSAATSVAAAATDNAASVAVGPMTFPGATITGTVKTSDGLEYKDLAVGTGTEAKTGDSVSVHYTGWLTNGTKFDSSVDRNQPFSFKLGNHEVISGWDEGVAGMKVGGKRILVIPPALGYGANANGPIPANSTLIFEVVLLSVQP